MNIFVADDEKLILDGELETIRNVFPDENIYGFRSGTEMLEKAKEVSCDIAFLDINMPDLTGIDAGEELKKLCPKVNIIFVTAYDTYFREAMEMHASGYLLKPIAEEDVIKEMEYLRFDIPEQKKTKLKVYCFGNFDVRTNNDESVHFERSRAKEAFAYIVSLNGRPCTLRELAAILFEDEPFDRKNQLYIQKIVSSMMKALRECNAEEVIEKNFNSFAVRPDLIECDYYEWLKDKSHSRYSVPDDYMRQYYWRLD